MKGIGLFSGGLDSQLAAKLIMVQKVDVLLVHFTHVFLTQKLDNVKHYAENLGAPLEVIDVSEDMVEIVRQPSHGYGDTMNPCIDCRIMTLVKAKQFMEDEADFIFTGEVVGQRPMTQMRHTMRYIERCAGLENKVVRPLSQKLLWETIPEKKGILDRNRLLAISGRGRHMQEELARIFGIKEFPAPAGGCLLTDPGFSQRIKDAIEHDKLSVKDVTLLKLGRHFRLPNGGKLILGRNRSENSKLEQLAEESDVLLRTPLNNAPIGVLRHGKLEDLQLAMRILLRYAKGERRVIVWDKKGNRNFFVTEPLQVSEVAKFMVKL